MGPDGQRRERGAGGGEPWAFHDPTAFGHGPNLLAGLQEAVAGAGGSSLAIGPVRPGDALYEIAAYDDDPTAPSPLATVTAPAGAAWEEDHLPRDAGSASRRRHVHDVADRATGWGAARLLVTSFDPYLGGRGWRASLALPTAAVVHTVDPGGTGARARARATATRSTLRSLDRLGGAVVVHTAPAADLLAAAGVPATHLPFPVLLAAPPAPRPVDQRVLFPGETRPEKGFPATLAAVQHCAAVEVFEVSGRVDSTGWTLIDAVDRRALTLDLAESGKNAARYRQAFQRAALVVLPLDEGYRRQGRTSATVLEAAAHGLPIVTTPAGASLLPPGHPGVVQAAGDPGSLASAIDEAFADLETLTAAARAAAPSLARTHSYSAFLDAVAGCLRHP